ncbi:hypothetical protein [Aquimarina sp. SS2-1]|uniref:hypothetical protein n=1 Tax=Aquimarina besae TaxID=3342247 RepID=UPI00366DEF54
MDFTIRENNNGRYISIDANDFEAGINFFTKQSNLFQIQLRGAYGQEKQTIDFNAFDRIAHQLKILSFSGLNGKLEIIENLDSIYNLVNLQKLFINDKINFKLDVSKFPKLTELGVLFSTKITGLEKLSELKKLVISGGYSKIDLAFFQELNSLEELHIYKSSKLENLKGLNYLKNLKKIKLAYNNKLNKIEATKETDLKILHIEKCNQLSDFSCLSENSIIEEIFIDNIASLSFIRDMNSLYKINFFHCEDGNMEPLIASKTLKQINFHPNKKHYTHTIEEVIEITGAQRGRNK